MRTTVDFEKTLCDLLFCIGAATKFRDCSENDGATHTSHHTIGLEHILSGAPDPHFSSFASLRKRTVLKTSSASHISSFQGSLSWFCVAEKCMDLGTSWQLASPVAFEPAL
jgi:hypothetical protein